MIPPNIKKIIHFPEIYFPRKPLSKKKLLSNKQTRPKINLFLLIFWLSRWRCPKYFVISHYNCEERRERKRKRKTMEAHLSFNYDTTSIIKKNLD